MLQAVCQHAQGQRFDAGNCLLPGCPVNHNPWELRNLGQPTPVLFLLDLASPSGSGLVGARLLDTLIGCGIVLVFGYLLWPQTWRAPFDEAMHGAAMALDEFVGAAFGGSATESAVSGRFLPTWNSNECRFFWSG